MLKFSNRLGTILTLKNSITNNPIHAPSDKASDYFNGRDQQDELSSNSSPNALPGNIISSSSRAQKESYFSLYTHRHTGIIGFFARIARALFGESDQARRIRISTDTVNSCKIILESVDLIEKCKNKDTNALQQLHEKKLSCDSDKNNIQVKGAYKNANGKFTRDPKKQFYLSRDSPISRAAVILEYTQAVENGIYIPLYKLFLVEKNGRTIAKTSSSSSICLYDSETSNPGKIENLRRQCQEMITSYNIPITKQDIRPFVTAMGNTYFPKLTMDKLKSKFAINDSTEQSGQHLMNYQGNSDTKKYWIQLNGNHNRAAIADIDHTKRAIKISYNEEAGSLLSPFSINEDSEEIYNLKQQGYKLSYQKVNIFDERKITEMILDLQLNTDLNPLARQCPNSCGTCAQRYLIYRYYKDKGLLHMLNTDQKKALSNDISFIQYVKDCTSLDEFKNTVNTDRDFARVDPKTENLIYPQI